MFLTEDDPAPKRRGRKASSSSRAAREAQRKMNHSIIEKARRTKINDALATLRVLVPAQPKRGGEEDEEDEPQDAGKEEKEFKLDVLVRTVTYLQELTARVKALEGAQGPGKCASCTGLKRKRADGEALEEAEDDHDSQAARQQPSPSDSNTRLPSIASWLPLDPSLIHKPSLHAPPTTTQHQLPSPPSSTTFRPSVSAQLPPAFALPASHAQGFGSTSAQPSPVLSPLTTRTPEDESVASLLLAMGASSRRSSSASEREREHAHAPQKGSVGARPQSEIQPWTPGSMLGLTKA